MGGFKQTNFKWIRFLFLTIVMLVRCHGEHTTKPSMYIFFAPGNHSSYIHLPDWNPSEENDGTLRLVGVQDVWRDIDKLIEHFPYLGEVEYSPRDVHMVAASHPAAAIQSAQLVLGRIGRDVQETLPRVFYTSPDPKLSPIALESVERCGFIRQRIGESYQEFLNDSMNTCELRGGKEQWLESISRRVGTPIRIDDLESLSPIATQNPDLACVLQQLRMHTFANGQQTRVGLIEMITLRQWLENHRGGEFYGAVTSSPLHLWGMLGFFQPQPHEVWPVRIRNIGLEVASYPPYRTRVILNGEPWDAQSICTFPGCHLNQIRERIDAQLARHPQTNFDVCFDRSILARAMEQPLQGSQVIMFLFCSLIITIIVVIGILRFRRWLRSKWD